MPVNKPVLYQDAAKNSSNALYPFLWRSLQIDWVPLLRYIPFIDMGHGKHNMALSGSGITYEISEIHEGLPVGRHTGSSGHLEHPRIVGFDIDTNGTFTIAVRISVTNTAGDQRTLFSKRVAGGSTHFSFRTVIGTAPQAVEVFFQSTSAPEITSATVIEIDTPYTIFVLNDGSELSGGAVLEIYSDQGILLDSATNSASYSNGFPAAPFWLFAAHSDGNDPMVGDHAGARGWERIITVEERQLLAVDWHALYRKRQRVFSRKIVAGGAIIQASLSEGVKSGDTEITVGVLQGAIVEAILAGDTQLGVSLVQGAIVDGVIGGESLDTFVTAVGLLTEGVIGGESFIGVLQGLLVEGAVNGEVFEFLYTGAAGLTEGVKVGDSWVAEGGEDVEGFGAYRLRQVRRKGR